MMFNILALASATILRASLTQASYYDGDNGKNDCEAKCDGATKEECFGQTCICLYDGEHDSYDGYDDELAIVFIEFNKDCSYEENFVVLTTQKPSYEENSLTWEDTPQELAQALTDTENGNYYGDKRYNTDNYYSDAYYNADYLNIQGQPFAANRAAYNNAISGRGGSDYYVKLDKYDKELYIVEGECEDLIEILENAGMREYFLKYESKYYGRDKRYSTYGGYQSKDYSDSHYYSSSYGSLDNGYGDSGGYDADYYALDKAKGKTFCYETEVYHVWHYLSHYELSIKVLDFLSQHKHSYVDWLHSDSLECQFEALADQYDLGSFLILMSLECKIYTTLHFAIEPLTANMNYNEANRQGRVKQQNCLVSDVGVALGIFADWSPYRFNEMLEHIANEGYLAPLLVNTAQGVYGLDPIYYAIDRNEIMPSFIAAFDKMAEDGVLGAVFIELSKRYALADLNRLISSYYLWGKVANIFQEYHIVGDLTKALYLAAYYGEITVIWIDLSEWDELGTVLRLLNHNNKLAGLLNDLAFEGTWAKPLAKASCASPGFAPVYWMAVLNNWGTVWDDLPKSWAAEALNQNLGLAMGTMLTCPVKYDLALDAFGNNGHVLSKYKPDRYWKANNPFEVAYNIVGPAAMANYLGKVVSNAGGPSTLCGMVEKDGFWEFGRILIENDHLDLLVDMVNGIAGAHQTDELMKCMACDVNGLPYLFKLLNKAGEHDYPEPTDYLGDYLKSLTKFNAKELLHALSCDVIEKLMKVLSECGGLDEFLAMFEKHGLLEKFMVKVADCKLHDKCTGYLNSMSDDGKYLICEGEYGYECSCNGGDGEDWHNCHGDDLSMSYTGNYNSAGYGGGYDYNSGNGYDYGGNSGYGSYSSGGYSNGAYSSNVHTRNSYSSGSYGSGYPSASYNTGSGYKSGGSSYGGGYNQYSSGSGYSSDGGYNQYSSGSGYSSDGGHNQYSSGSGYNSGSGYSSDGGHNQYSSGSGYSSDGGHNQYSSGGSSYGGGYNQHSTGSNNYNHAGSNNQYTVGYGQTYSG